MLWARVMLALSLQVFSVGLGFHAVIGAPPADIDMIYSRGSTFHVIDVEDQKVNCEDFRNLPFTIVPAGVEIVIFKSKKLSCKDADRVLALTVHGLWGYWKLAKPGTSVGPIGRTYWHPNELKKYAGKKGVAAIITRNGVSMANDQGVSKSVYVTHAETYEFVGMSGNTHYYIKPLFYDDAKSKNLSSETAIMKVDRDKVKLVRFSRYRFPGMGGNGSPQREAAKQLYRSIKQIRSYFVSEFSKVCGEKRIVITTKGGKFSIAAGINVDLSARGVGVKLGANVEAEVKSEIQSSFNHSESINIFTKIFEVQDHKYLFKLKRYNPCVKKHNIYGSSNKYFHYYIGTESREIWIDDDLVSIINEELKLSLHFNHRSGKIVLSCIEEYQKVLDFLTQFYKEQESVFILSRVIEIFEPKNLGRCVYSQI